MDAAAPYGKLVYTVRATLSEKPKVEGPPAIEAGVETLSVADVNDPALIVAKAMGRTHVVVVMDDHVAPDAYWPCFQAIAARFERGDLVVSDPHEPVGLCLP